MPFSTQKTSVGKKDASRIAVQSRLIDDVRTDLNDMQIDRVVEFLLIPLGGRWVRTAGVIVSLAQRAER